MLAVANAQGRVGEALARLREVERRRYEATARMDPMLAVTLAGSVSLLTREFLSLV